MKQFDTWKVAGRVLFLCQLPHRLLLKEWMWRLFLNHTVYLRSTVTHVLNLYDVEIYEIACVIWDRAGDSTHTRTMYASASKSLFCSCVMWWEATVWAQFVSLLTLTVAGCSWSCMLWWWYSPLGLLYSEIPRPHPPFVTTVIGRFLSHVTLLKERGSCT